MPPVNFSPDVVTVATRGARYFCSANRSFSVVPYCGAGLSSLGPVSCVVALQATVDLFFESNALTNLRLARRITAITSQSTIQRASRGQDAGRGAEGKSYELMVLRSRLFRAGCWVVLPANALTEICRVL